LTDYSLIIGNFIFEIRKKSKPAFPAVSGHAQEGDVVLNEGVDLGLS